MRVYDFTSMYSKFVQHDMKRILRLLLRMVYAFKAGQRVLIEDDQLGPLSLIYSMLDEPIRSLKVTYKQRYNGVQNVDGVKWSPSEPGGRRLNARPGFHLDADGVADIADFCISNSYVQHRGRAHRQSLGLAMGMSCSPQIANLYCAFYELNYMSRRVRGYLQMVRVHRHLSERSLEKAIITALLNGFRMIDDIGLPGLPMSTAMVTQMMVNTMMLTNGTLRLDGFYPAAVEDEDGILVSNPMELKLERSTMSCAYMDVLFKLSHRQCHHLPEEGLDASVR